jgi:hypothetical protein
MTGVKLLGSVAAGVMLSLWRGVQPYWEAWHRRRHRQRLIARVMGH